MNPAESAVVVPGSKCLLRTVLKRQTCICDILSVHLASLRSGVGEGQILRSLLGEVPPRPNDELASEPEADDCTAT